MVSRSLCRENNKFNHLDQILNSTSDHMQKLYCFEVSDFKLNINFSAGEVGLDFLVKKSWKLWLFDGYLFNGIDILKKHESFF